MKKLLLILCLFLAFNSYSQITRKYNSLQERYEFYNSNSQLVGYAKYNSLQERWEFYNSNNQMYAYSKYNSLTGETNYVELNSNNSNSSGSGRFIIHNYGEPQSNFDTDLAILALKYRQQQYDKLSRIYNNLTLEQKQKLNKYINNYNRKEFDNYVYVGKSREVELNKNTVGFKTVLESNVSRNEFIYQRKIKDKTRLELSFGLINDQPYNSYKIASTYQWVGNVLGYLNMYGGLGLAIKNVEKDESFVVEDRSGLYTMAVGTFGFEYNFSFPLIIFVDFDINYSFTTEFGLEESGAGIGLRYGF